MKIVLEDSIQVSSSPYVGGMWDLYRDGVTQSMLSVFLVCPEKFKHAYCSGKQSLKEKSEAMDYGDFQHGILDAIYSSFRQRIGEVKTTPEEFIQEVEEFCRRMCVHYDSLERDEMERNGYDVSTLVKIAALSYHILPRYFHYWKKQDFLDTKWVDLEKVFKVTFTNKLLKKPITLKGKWDGVYEKSTRLRLLETKTKIRFNEDYIEAYLPLDLQTMFYLISMRIHYGQDPTGVTYNLIKRSELRVKKTENIAEYAQRVADEVDENPVKFFQRIDGHVSRFDLDEAEKDLATKLSMLEKWWLGEFHYRNTTQCMGSFKPCDFLPLCGQGREDLYGERKDLFPELRVF